MYTPLNFVTTEEAIQIRKILNSKEVKALIPENRVLILSPTMQEQKVGKIILPGTMKEDIPHKGVVIDRGYLSEDNSTYRELVDTGRVITYGLYGGKKIDFDPNLFKGISMDGQEFSILSVNEIIFSEINPNV